MAAAQHVRAMIDRVAGPGDGSSWLDQLAAHGRLAADPVEKLWSADEELAATDLLMVLGQQLRKTRARTGGFGHAVSESPWHVGAAREDGYLPLNRKERYYTGTVLPMVIASDNFAHLHRFLRLCGLSAATVSMEGPEEMPALQFFTEYSFFESVVTTEDRERFRDRPMEADTPDIVLVGRDWLLAVEAKMFHRPSRQALEQQMRRQRALVDYWAKKLRIEQVAHVLLLPTDLADARQGMSVPIVTMEAVAEAYALVGPPYWVDVLRSAIVRYPALASPEPTFRTNADALLTGREIFASGAHPEYAWVGRKGGLTGAPLQADLTTGDWMERQYEVRTDPLPENPNWFAAEAFVAKIQLLQSSLEYHE